ncbi:MAG: Holliday junction branch migration protein RuvA [Bacteroidales bacterium]|nr:Holliday junction branch migration protein RuvA [Bacteroidales bacterium]
MINYIIGTITELSPTYVVVETAGIGYFINISINTYSKLENKTSYRILIHEVIREDARQFFGFADEEERNIFRHLISVSGIGANTARMILSSLTPADITKAINEANVNLLKGIKGIGIKTAQRIIIDLKDKIGKQKSAAEIFIGEDNTKHEEALSALVMLGFSRNAVMKVLDRIISEDKKLTVEELIKRALKNL